VPAGEGEGPCQGRHRTASPQACWFAPGWRSGDEHRRPPGGIALARVPLACLFDSLSCFFDPGFPDADLVFSLSVADEVGTDPPVVVLQGCSEDNIVHVVVTGEGSSEPDWHLGQWEVGVFHSQQGRRDDG
jgi:hypothetical protein